MPFPKDFTWGVAAAAYQVEGAATEGGRLPSVWDTFCRKPDAVKDGDTGDVACDHYHRYEEDADLIAGLGAKAYRLSISWPRVVKIDGTPNEEGLAFYDRVVDALLARGITPWVTLFHWDFPQHLFEQGGWLNRDSVRWFADYTRIVVDRLGDRVAHWFTLNEPQVFLQNGHGHGFHAPGLKYDTPALLRCAHHALMAHGRAVQILREHSKTTARVGLAPVGCSFIPATESAADIEAARRATFATGDQPGWLFSTAWFAEPALKGHYPEDGLSKHGHHLPAGFESDLSVIHQPVDFYGCNIYSSPTVKAGDPADPAGEPVPVPQPTGGPQTMFRWPVTPDALYWGPKFLADRYNLPIYITENGCAGMDWVHVDGKVHDAHRVDFLHRYLGALQRAATDGTDIRGYFQWSIMDNFEWEQGYQLRFGLIHVDYATQKRTPKDSYHWYKKVIAANGV